MAVAAAIWISASDDSAPEMPEMASIQFVEISDDFVDAMPAQAAPQVVMAPTPSEPETESDIAPPAEPEAVPEPEVALEPEPETIPEPESLPEPVSEPEMVAPAPKPKPKPELKPEPKPEPKPKPKPKAEPKSKPQPAPATSSAPAEPVVPAPSGQASAPASPKAPAAPADLNTPRFISQVDYAGRRPVPEYPRASVRRGETGRVLVRVLISPTGSVQDASVRKSSGHSRLDEAAVKAAKTARFKPYVENGVARPALADIPFDFVL